MRSFIRGFGSVLLALMLASGWAWTKVLETRGYIGGKLQIYILLALTIVLAIQQVYLVLPRPVSRKTIESRRRIVEFYLHGFLSNYYRIVRGIRSNGESLFPIVRVNIMLITKPLKGLAGSHLKIYYYACPRHVVYPDSELSIKCKKKNGTCGWTWFSGDMSIYDSEDPTLKLPAKRLKKKQSEIVAYIKSTLSVPIHCEDGDVVGIMNLDSKQNLGNTYFTHEEVYSIAYRCASEIGAFCSKHGVKA